LRSLQKPLRLCVENSVSRKGAKKKREGRRVNGNKVRFKQKMPETPNN
jgi:hypothetical protein